MWPQENSFLKTIHLWSGLVVPSGRVRFLCWMHFQFDVSFWPFSWQTGTKHGWQCIQTPELLQNNNEFPKLFLAHDPVPEKQWLCVHGYNVANVIFMTQSKSTITPIFWDDSSAFSQFRFCMEEVPSCCCFHQDSSNNTAILKQITFLMHCGIPFLHFIHAFLILWLSLCPFLLALSHSPLALLWPLWRPALQRCLLPCVML